MSWRYFSVVALPLIQSRSSRGRRSRSIKKMSPVQCTFVTVWESKLSQNDWEKKRNFINFKTIAFQFVCVHVFLILPFDFLCFHECPTQIQVNRLDFSSVPIYYELSSILQSRKKGIKQWACEYGGITICPHCCKRKPLQADACGKVLLW